MVSKKGKTVMVVRRFPKVETKYLDSGPTTWNFDTTSTLSVLNPIAQANIATDVNNRVGRRVMNTHVHIRGIVNPQDTSSGPTLCAMYLIRDTQSNGSSASTTDFLTTITSTAFRNQQNLKRFIVLWEEHFAVGQISDTATQSFAGAPTVHTVEKHVNLNFESVYSGVSGSTPITNAIYLLTVGNQAAGSGAAFNGAVRLSFEDA
jgi:hypothetical protein